MIYSFSSGICIPLCVSKICDSFLDALEHSHFCAEIEAVFISNTSYGVLTLSNRRKIANVIYIGFSIFNVWDLHYFDLMLHFLKLRLLSGMCG